MTRRPSPLARWGWLFTALQVVLVLANLLMIVAFDGGLANWLAAALAAGCGIFCFVSWRNTVRSDAEHRAFMDRLESGRWTR